jgi:hypothetical protein
MEETKSAPRRKSMRKSVAKPIAGRAAQVATVDAMADTGESEGAYLGSPSIHSETSDIGEISNTDSGEDEDLSLQGAKSVGDTKPQPGSSGVEHRSSFIRRDTEGSVASSIDTFRSMSLGQGSKGRKKGVTQPKGTLKEEIPKCSHRHVPSFVQSTRRTWTR